MDKQLNLRCKASQNRGQRGQSISGTGVRGPGQNDRGTRGKTGENSAHDES